MIPSKPASKEGGVLISPARARSTPSRQAWCCYALPAVARVARIRIGRVSATLLQAIPCAWLTGRADRAAGMTARSITFPLRRAPGERAADDGWFEIGA